MLEIPFCGGRTARQWERHLLLREEFPSPPEKAIG
jgi:hypothetical protein